MAASLIAAFWMTTSWMAVLWMTYSLTLSKSKIVDDFAKFEYVKIFSVTLPNLSNSKNY